MNALPSAVQTFGVPAWSNLFMTFTRHYMQQAFNLDDLCEALRLVGAVHCTFRS
jgi:uncharacterized protein (DUF486 family)